MTVDPEMFAQSVEAFAKAYFYELRRKPTDSDAAHLCDLIWGALAEVEAKHV